MKRWPANTTTHKIKLVRDHTKMMTNKTFFRRKKSCPFSGEDGIKIDYKDIENNFKFRNLKNLYSANIVYFYPAYFYPHKNHFKLIKAFEALDKLKIKPYKLLLTLSNNEFKKIFKIKSSNVVLLNKLSYSEIFNTYRYVDYLIYPSLLESYGLPLLEAKLSGIDIIASDLPYVYDICKPKFVFDPNDINSISNIIKYSTLTNKRIN